MTNFGGQARRLYLTASREEHPLKKLGLGDTESRELLGVQGRPITGTQTPKLHEMGKDPLPQATPASSRPAILSWFLNAARSSPQCSGSCPLPSPPPLSPNLYLGLVCFISLFTTEFVFPFCSPPEGTF